MDVKEQQISSARRDIEEFFDIPHSEKGLFRLEDGLCLLKDLQYSGVGYHEARIIANVLGFVRGQLIREADRLFNIEPIVSYKEAMHWLEAMKIYSTSGCQVDENFKRAANDLYRAARISKDEKGNLSRELRRFYFHEDLSGLKL